MDGSGEKLTINPNLCIGCGNCIAACSHKARVLMDDSSRFFRDIKQGEKMIAIVAPAIASFLPDHYLNLNGYLKSLGVAEVFDVSFGAELTVTSYVDHIKKKNPRMVISQPCPAIVTFIEIYHPELLSYLAPADSPMLHSIKMIREYYSQFHDHKMLIISPCIAKRREFDDTGMGDYNVTFLSIKNHLDEKKIDLSGYPAAPYMGALAERAVQFSSPGGLLDTAERFVPGIRRRTNKIEGVHTIYPYLAELSGQIKKPDIWLPQLVDCLNCEKGCNGGPGTGNHNKPQSEL
jgi:iron only hydrogenase large subunit-like protein